MAGTETRRENLFDFHSFHDVCVCTIRITVSENLGKMDF